MIRLGLRLTFGSGRDAILRAAIVAAAVALGVSLLLAALAGVNGLHAQSARGAWLDTVPGHPIGCSGPACPHPAGSGTSTSAQLWWLASTDQIGNQAIDRVDLAPTGPGAPVTPGIPRLPAPGEYYASPALSTLMASVPPSELRNRFPGHQVGVIGAAALPSPDSLIIVIGHRPSQLASVAGAVEVSHVLQGSANCLNCQNDLGSGPVLQWILAIAAVALLLPVLILIATASRLSAARREERFAAMRLVGATAHQISVVSAVEATLAATAGMAFGFVLFVLFRPLLYHVPFTGAPFAPGDLALSGVDVLLVVIGVPLAAAVSARMGLRRVVISPLGVRRHVSSAPPRAIRLVPLVVGIAVLSFFDVAGKPGSTGGQIQELLLGFVLIGVGLVLAGPWFTFAASRLMARRANRPETLLAGRRMLDNPKAAFRFVSGLVLALFVTSAAIGALTSISAAGATEGGTEGTSTLALLFTCYGVSPCPASSEVPSPPRHALTTLRTTAGVRAITLIHQNPSSGQEISGSALVACEQLDKTPAIGRCARGSSVATIGYFLSNIGGHNSHAATTTWPSAHVTQSSLVRLPLDAVVVATDGSPASIERTRTVLEEAFPFQGIPVSVVGLNPSKERLLIMVQDMAEVIVVASLIIAACSLAVNIAAGLGERKRPFSLLRLSGTPLATLRKVVALEGAVPLVVVATFAIAVGLTAAALYLRSEVGIAFEIPGGLFWVTVLGGIFASLGIIASTFPMLERITGPEVARNE
jgi:FtsX-like permease family